MDGKISLLFLLFYFPNETNKSKKRDSCLQILEKEDRKGWWHLPNLRVGTVFLRNGHTALNAPDLV